MKRTLKYLLPLMLLAVFAGCVQEKLLSPEGINTPEYPKEGKAIIHMSALFPGTPGTKSMADTPDIDLIRVAVFGSSGFLKEVVDAENFEAATTNGNSTLYTFDVKLSITDSKNLRINVFANCNAKLPWKYEGVVMCGSAFTSGNQDAYWARFTLPNGIPLKMVYDETEGVMVYVKEGNYYQVTDEVTEAFCGGKDSGGNYRGLPMLRNFAKMSVESTTPQLTLDPTTTMAIVNMPDRGSVAPYDPSRSLFMSSYKDSTYAQLKAHYPGYSPDSMQYLNTDPATVSFHPCGKDNNGNVTGGIYMFERPKPSGSSDSPTYIIIHGKYRAFQSGKTMKDWKDATGNNKYPNNPDNWLVPVSQAVDGYYKIDLMDEDGYYAVLRNFRYHLRITGVSKPGASTPAEAGSTGGSGDISATQETQGLTDISNGYGRISVSYVERTFVEGHDVVELKYKFIPDIEEGDNEIDNRLQSEGGPVIITIDKASGPINVISNTLDSSISSATGVDIGTSTGTNATGLIKVMGSNNSDNDNEGFRTIKFTVNNPSNENRSEQTIHIRGMIDEYRSISRDVKFYLMEHQTMTVTCIADKPDSHFASNAVEDVVGEGINVKVNIPTQLPESMFPLIFNIESDKLSITPNTADYDDNLPVESGPSICAGKTGKKTFHYNYTLSYKEYEALHEESTGGKSFICHFKTNMADSAGSIYVANEYFVTASAPFINYSVFNFSKIRFSNYNAGANTNLNCTFYMDEEDTATSRTITVLLEGLRPQTNASPWVTVDSSIGLYTYTFSNNGGVGGRMVTLPVATLAAGQHNGHYSVTLSLDDAQGAPVYREKEHATTSVISHSTTITFTQNNYNPVTKDDVTVSFSNASWNNSSVRFRYGAYMTVTVPDEYEITRLSLTTYNTTISLTANSGTYTRSSNTAATWTSSAATSSVRLTTSNNGTCYIRELTIEYQTFDD